MTTSNVVTYTVIINAPNPDQKLLPGMTANIVIYAEEHENVLTVPYKAMKFKPEAEYLARMDGGPASGNAPGAMSSRAGVPSVSGTGPGSVPAGEGRTVPGSVPGAESGSVLRTVPGEVTETAAKVWIRTADGIRPVPVQLGSNDGENAEVISGLKEGDEVVVKMTVATSAKKKEKTVASNPFMPTPPGRRNTQGTSRTGANPSSRTQQ
ncbi:hypothetical protein EG830_08570 [bacterium]|nr:hypothetical protein [bacterium]